MSVKRNCRTCRYLWWKKCDDTWVPCCHEAEEDIYEIPVNELDNMCHLWEARKERQKGNKTEMVEVTGNGLGKEKTMDSGYTGLELEKIEQADIFDRIVGDMEEFLSSNKADLVSFNVSTKNNRRITLTIEEND